MAFIKTQKLVRYENGTRISGSVSIVDIKNGNYGTYHAKHSVSEKRLEKLSGSLMTRKRAFFGVPYRISWITLVLDDWWDHIIKG